MKPEGALPKAMVVRDLGKPIWANLGYVDWPSIVYEGGGHLVEDSEKPAAANDQRADAMGMRSRLRVLTLPRLR